MNETPSILDFAKLVIGFLLEEETALSEDRFEKAVSRNWKRVHHCLLFPKTEMPTSAFYGETESLFNHSVKKVEPFNKRAPTASFRLLNLRDMQYSRRDCAGLYSYGAYLDGKNKIREGLLQAHIFLRAAGQYSEVKDLLEQCFSNKKLNYGVAALDEQTLNFFCARPHHDAHTETAS